LDDDITGFGRVENMKVNNATAAEVLTRIEDLVDDSPRIAMAGPEFPVWARMHQKAWKMHTRVVCCMLMSSYTGVDYDLNIASREDLDFCIATLLAGWETILVQDCVMKIPKPGNPGGCATVISDRAKSDAEGDAMLMEKYPGLISPRKGKKATVRWARI